MTDSLENRVAELEDRIARIEEHLLAESDMNDPMRDQGTMESFRLRLESEDSG